MVATYLFNKDYHTIVIIFFGLSKIQSTMDFILRNSCHKAASEGMLKSVILFLLPTTTHRNSWPSLSQNLIMHLRKHLIVVWLEKNKKMARLCLILCPCKPAVLADKVPFGSHGPIISMILKCKNMKKCCRVWFVRKKGRANWHYYSTRATFWALKKLIVLEFCFPLWQLALGHWREIF